MNDLNADIILAIFVATTVLLILSSFGIIFTIIYKKKQHAHQNERKLLQVRFQEELLKSQLEIKEGTLRYIAYELHDNLGQIASLIKINLNTLSLTDEEKAARKIEDTKDLVRQLIYDLKSLSMSLNSDRVIQVGIIGEFTTSKFKKQFLPIINLRQVANFLLSRPFTLNGHYQFPSEIVSIVKASIHD